MQRYFVPENNWKENSIKIKDEDAHHIARVMRCNPGDKIVCVHPDGQVAKCQIHTIEKNEVNVQIIEWLDENTELPVHVTIVQGLPKGNKLEFILQKGTELGAAEFWLWKSDRSIVKWDDKKSAQKIKRYCKIIKEASEQCHRNKIPNLKEPMTIDQIIQASNEYDVKLFAYEEEARTADYVSLSSHLIEVSSDNSIIICIGPEGGLSSEEVSTLKKNHFIPVRLGPRILRTETASLYALAGISYHFEELRWN
ncbi:16S rRNA (uracil(1498)-N(3))-methyltransferase [Pseudogracilibacillus sp. SE30717A]|uniref:16S rRNA (uracil(1498)-N(3))-methyltransferase n=1 Tax=Pseudogracilibacillus sp. SE30717A TaxID=3098293 RepID=UPI00300E00FF